MVVYEIISCKGVGHPAPITQMDDDPSLASLQEAVGGYIEYIPPSMIGMGGVIDIIANEEGMVYGLPINHLPTQLLAPHVPHPLVGNVVVVTPNGLVELVFGGEEE